MTERKPLPRWPLLFVGLPAATAIWSGWVGVGGMTGFGVVHPLPGIAPHFQINTVLTLPVGVEAYGAYALGAWLGSWDISPEARRFAKWSALAALGLGALGQIAYHLMAAHHVTIAPWIVTVLVAIMPVVVVGCAAALIHLMHSELAEAQNSCPQTTSPEPETTVMPIPAGSGEVPEFPVSVPPDQPVSETPEPPVSRNQGTKTRNRGGTRTRDTRTEEELVLLARAAYAELMTLTGKARQKDVAGKVNKATAWVNTRWSQITVGQTAEETVR